MTISYSIETGYKPTYAQSIEIGELSEETFHNNSDPEQMQVTEKEVKWYRKNFPIGMNLIMDDNVIVGFTFIFLSDSTEMNKFLNKSIGENELSGYFMTHFGKKKFDCVYLCAAFVKPEYRGHGLATIANIKQIKAIMKKHPIKKAFYWGYSESGSKTAKNIAKKSKLPLYSRKV